MKKFNFYETLQEFAKLNNVHCILPVDVLEFAGKKVALIECYSSNAQCNFIQSLKDCEICQGIEIVEILGYKLIINYEPKES